MKTPARQWRKRDNLTPEQRAAIEAWEDPVMKAAIKVLDHSVK